MNYYMFNVADYRKDTQGLSHIEHYIYRTLLDECYLTELPLNPDFRELMRFLRLTSDQKDDLSYVLDKFFELTDDGYINHRVNSILSKAYDRSEKARAAVNARWEKYERKKNRYKRNTDVEHENNVCNTDDIQPITHYPLPSSSGSSATSVRFAEFWDVYPRERRRDKKKALAIWKRRNLDTIADQIIEDVKNRIDNDDQWKRGFVPMPTTYLNGDRWEDELGGDSSTEPGFGQGGI